MLFQNPGAVTFVISQSIVEHLVNIIIAIQNNYAIAFVRLSNNYVTIFF